MVDWIRTLKLSTISWPLRKFKWWVMAVRRGNVYGIPKPQWWPRKYPWNLGPQCDHLGKEVTIFLPGERYVFKPVVYGRYQGHVHQGKLIVDTDTVHSRLEGLSLPTDIAQTLSVVSSLEGGFDTLQTYDRAKFTWGFIQFAAFGGLPGLLGMIKTTHPDLFQSYFITAGIDIDNGSIIITHGGNKMRGFRALNRLHDDPKLWKNFLMASHDPIIQGMQILFAYENYYQRILALKIKLASQGYSLGDLFQHNEYGRAVLFDRAINQGLVYAARLFKQAVRKSGIQSPDDADDILSAAKQMEPHFQKRWEYLYQAFHS